jgi:hypothetical protein
MPYQTSGNDLIRQVMLFNNIMTMTRKKKLSSLDDGEMDPVALLDEFIDELIEKAVEIMERSRDQREKSR